MIDLWSGSDELRHLVDAFGHRVPPRLSGEGRLAWLDDFSVAWDFRAGVERDGAAVAELTGEQEAAVASCSVALGQSGRETPPRRRYDAVIMTGGMVRAGIVKPRFVRDLLAAGLETPEIVFLGALRPFSREEEALAEALGVDGGAEAAADEVRFNEVGAMLSGMRMAFGPLGAAEVGEAGHRSSTTSWREYSWNVDSRRLQVVAAASSDPGRRANTIDTFHHWAAHRGLPAGSSVLLVTTPIYVPYQNAVAVHALGIRYGLSVDTVGTSASANDLGIHTQEFRAQHHLQELRSAIRAMRMLRAALVQYRP